MKYFILTFCLSASLAIQGQSITPWVLANAGDHSENGFRQSIEWTLGELATTTLTSSSGSIITQGFHQPDLLATSVDDHHLNSSVRVFPNPVNHELNFENNSG